jgi:hypothetical protein
VCLAVDALGPHEPADGRRLGGGAARHALRARRSPPWGFRSACLGGLEPERVKFPTSSVPRMWFGSRTGRSPCVGTGSIIEVVAGDRGVRFDTGTRATMEEQTGIPAAAGVLAMLADPYSSRVCGHHQNASLRRRFSGRWHAFRLSAATPSRTNRRTGKCRNNERESAGTNPHS